MRIDMSWSFFKKKGKGIVLAPGQSLEVGISTRWIDKDKVAILTPDGPVVLGEKDKFYIEVKADNINPIRVQIVPDFKNRKLNFIEILDPNAKNITKENGPKLKFSGSIVVEDGSFDDILMMIDKDIEALEKLIKGHNRQKNLFTIIFAILIPINLFLFIIVHNIYRYINLIAIIVLTYTLFSLRRQHIRLCELHKRYKKQKEEMFGIVKKT